MVKRNANVDLFRMIATVFVIILHVLGQGGIYRNAPMNSITYHTASFLRILTFCAVNCFALISGYVMANKNIKLKSIIGLWLNILFYSVLFSGLFFAFMPETITLKNLVQAFLPVVTGRWWYISSYFALFFFIPFLNTAIQYISKQTYTKVLLVIIVGLCVLDCIIPIDAFYTNEGFSAIWLIILYLFGAYIKKYAINEKIAAWKGLIGFFVMIILTFASQLVISALTKILFGEAKFDGVFISYISITILFSAIFLFIFCLNVKLSNFTSKLILFFSPVSLGIFLIHVDPLVYHYLLKDAFVFLAQKNAVVMLLGVVAATIGIFLVCAIIDLLRIQLFKLIRINKLCEFIANNIKKVYSKFFENL